MTDARARMTAFRSRYKSGELIMGMTCSMASPISVEIIGHSGYDFVVVDTEMLSVNPETLENMIRAAECSKVLPIVKLKKNDPIMITDALNAGAPMVKVPHAITADDLRRACDAAYFHPRGERGLCTVARANLFSVGVLHELVEWTNRDALVVPIIEDVEALDNLDELFSFEGIDIYDVGPVDMSHSMGLQPGKGFGHPEVAEALDKICAAAKRHGKHVMTVPVFGEPPTPQIIKERLYDRGVNLVFNRPDSVTLRIASKEVLRVREMV